MCQIIILNVPQLDSGNLAVVGLPQDNVKESRFLDGERLMNISNTPSLNEHMEETKNRLNPADITSHAVEENDQEYFERGLPYPGESNTSQSQSAYHTNSNLNTRSSYTPPPCNDSEATNLILNMLNDPIIDNATDDGVRENSNITYAQTFEDLFLLEHQKTQTRSHDEGHDISIMEANTTTYEKDYLERITKETGKYS